MKAVKLSEPNGTVSVEEVDIPVPGEGEILIRVEASGLCYTDVHICDGDWELLDDNIKRDLTLGHEAIGIVEALGPGVSSLKPGDRVAAPFLRSACGRCRQCRGGHENHCPNATVLGMSHDGSHAEYVIGVADYVVPVPEGLAPEQAAPLVCAGMTVYGALRDAGVGVGTTLGVIGVGGQGHYAIQLGKVMGATVVAIDIDSNKLDLASTLGADLTLLADGEGVVEKLVALDIAVMIVTAPSDDAHQLAIASVAFGGTISLCAVPRAETPISMTACVFKGITLVSQGVATRQQLTELLNLAAQGKIVSHVETRALRDAPEAINALRSRKIVGRVVFVPDN